MSVLTRARQRWPARWGRSTPQRVAIAQPSLQASRTIQAAFRLPNLTNAFVLTPGNPGLLPTAQDSQGRRVLSNPINRLDNSWTGLSLRASVDMDSMTLTSITSWMKYRNRQYYDYDATPLRLFEEQPGDARIDSWSQDCGLSRHHINH